VGNVGKDPGENIEAVWDRKPGVGPAAEPLLFRQKWPKPLTPRSAIFQEANTECRKAGQLALLKQGPPICADVCL
jgi:hypothetical protein